MLKRTNLENLMSHFMYELDSSREVFEDYEKRMEKSLDEPFEKLENMYDKADRNDSNLLNALVDFAVLNEEIFLKLEFQLGQN